MAHSLEDGLLEAVKKDDLKAFDALAGKAQCGAYRLGRFPVLSLLYLYKSRKILSAHEQEYIKIASWELLREPFEISKTFSAKAGKCLRLYTDEIVTPLEMLLLLDRVKKLKAVYPLTKASSAVKGRLKSIYFIKYSLTVKFEGDNILIDRRPLSHCEKKRIATACLCSLLAVSLAVGVPWTTVALIPEPVEGEVKKLEQIDFSSKKEFTLKRDISVPENFSVAKVNCTISGGGHKLIFGTGASLGEFNGKLSDLTIVSTGNPIFTTISESAQINNITINVTASVTTDTSSALVAMTNYGTIDGVTLNVGGSVGAVASAEGDDGVTFGALVQTNAYKSQQSYGTISNCTVNFSQFSLYGEVQADAAFGGIAGVNSGMVEDCTVTGEITADTFDIAGVCVGNNGLLTGNINEADLSQVSSGTGWHPASSGVVIENVHVVEYCTNKGSVSAVSTCAPSEGEDAVYVSSAGIAYYNSGTIGACTNSGTISAKGSDTVYAGGISARSYGMQTNCLSSGDIIAEADVVYAGGILACSEVYYEVGFFGYSFVWGAVDYCISECSITASGGYVGGIVGCVLETGVQTWNGTVYFGGGVTDSFFTGQCLSSVAFGNIAGGVGENIYESNSYTSEGIEYHNFKNNCYAENSFTAFVGLDDKEASAQTEEQIKNSEEYKKILDNLLKF